jgi:hypothetical protein
MMKPIISLKLIVVSLCLKIFLSSSSIFPSWFTRNWTVIRHCLEVFYADPFVITPLLELASRMVLFASSSLPIPSISKAAGISLPQTHGGKCNHVAYIIMMNGGPISWKSRRQDSVALSTSEAVWLRARLARKFSTFALFFAMWVTHKLRQLIFMRTTWHASLCLPIMFAGNLLAILTSASIPAGAACCWCCEPHSSSDPPHGCRRTYQESSWPCSYSAP